MTNRKTHYFAELDPDGFLVQTHHVDGPEPVIDGPMQALEPPGCPEGNSVVEIGAPFSFAAPSVSSRARLVDGIPTWFETATLAELKARKNAAINSARLAANRATFVFAGKVIACDTASVLEMQSVNGEVCLTRALPAHLGGGWKALDNSYVAIPDIAAWTAFYQAMVRRSLDNFRGAQQLKAALQQADTFDAVAAIHLPKET